MCPDPRHSDQPDAVRRKGIVLTETIYRLPVPFSIAVAGDFHNRDYRSVLASLKRHRPSIIAIPGDLAFNRLPGEQSVLEDQKNILPFLRGCSQIAPVFISLGNHDNLFLKEDMERIRETGVNVLDNEWIEYDRAYIGGLTSHYVLDRRIFRQTHTAGEKWGPACRLVKEPKLDWMTPLPEGYTILLSHHPEYYPRIPEQIDLILSGHAHGGQWRIFGRGLYAPGQGIFPRWTSGITDGRMVITRGLADTVKIPRLNNKTELVYLMPA